MKRKFALFLGIAVILMITLASCKPSEVSPTPSPPETNSPVPAVPAWEDYLGIWQDDPYGTGADLHITSIEDGGNIVFYLGEYRLGGVDAETPVAGTPALSVTRFSQEYDDYTVAGTITLEPTCISVVLESGMPYQEEPYTYYFTDLYSQTNSKRLYERFGLSSGGYITAEVSKDPSVLICREYNAYASLVNEYTINIDSNAQLLEIGEISGKSVAFIWFQYPWYQYPPVEYGQVVDGRTGTLMYYELGSGDTEMTAVKFSDDLDINKPEWTVGYLYTTDSVCYYEGIGYSLPEAARGLGENGVFMLVNDSTDLDVLSSYLDMHLIDLRHYKTRITSADMDYEQATNEVIQYLVDNESN